MPKLFISGIHTGNDNIFVGAVVILSFTGLVTGVFANFIIINVIAIIDFLCSFVQFKVNYSFLKLKSFLGIFPSGEGIFGILCI